MLEQLLYLVSVSSPMWLWILFRAFPLKKASGDAPKGNSLVTALLAIALVLLFALLYVISFKLRVGADRHEISTATKSVYTITCYVFVFISYYTCARNNIITAVFWYIFSTILLTTVVSVMWFWN